MLYLQSNWAKKMLPKGSIHITLFNDRLSTLITFVELIHAASRINNTLFTGIERMTF